VRSGFVVVGLLEVGIDHSIGSLVFVIADFYSIDCLSLGVKHDVHAPTFVVSVPRTETLGVVAKTLPAVTVALGDAIFAEFHPFFECDH
jgi:hypothetical protein